MGRKVGNEPGLAEFVSDYVRAARENNEEFTAEDIAMDYAGEMYGTLTNEEFEAEWPKLMPDVEYYLP